MARETITENSLGGQCYSRIPTGSCSAQQHRPKCRPVLWRHGNRPLEQTNLGRVFQDEHGDSLHSRDIEPMSPELVRENGSDQFAYFRRSSSRQKGSCLRAVGDENPKEKHVSPN